MANHHGKPGDLGLRRVFGEWALDQLNENPLFYREILFSDGAHFWLYGYINKQNCRIWADEQPEEFQQLSLHPQKCTVWCGIVGPYFFKNEAGQNVTVNGDRYRTMITDYLLPEIEARGLNELWFQQDGATSHTARQTMDLLRNRFGEHLISSFGPVNWPPRSCDITPLEYFLWGYTKSLVFRDKPASTLLVSFVRYRSLCSNA